MITLKDYWMGRDIQFPEQLTDEIISNAMKTVDAANALLNHFANFTHERVERKVNSGWRPPTINASTPGSAPKSKHMTGQAIDISDPDGDLDDWCMEHLDILEVCGLWMEHPSATKGWCHVQIVPPKSGKRVFYP